MKPTSQDIVGTEGEELKGKTIVLGITGSVSAYRAPDIARSLMRHGAAVHAVMTAGAQKIIHPNAMEWATGNPVVTELTGKIEHVAFTTGPGKADLILVAPATANTVGKMAAGIDDTTVTSFVSSALGGEIPIIVAPAMHDTMLNHRIIMDNIKKLEENGVVFVPPSMEEGKAKLAPADDILAFVISALSTKDMVNTSVLITGGPTAEPVDAVRVLTNRSSGKMAVALAAVARRRGATVKLIYGPGSAAPPNGVEVIHVGTADEMYERVVDELDSGRYRLMIAAAAVSDYRPAKPLSTKIDSSKDQRLRLELVRTRKIIDEVKKVSPSTFLVIFKAEHSLPSEVLSQRARRRLREANADMVVVNDVGKEGIGFGSDDNEVTVISPGSKAVRIPRAPKDSIADRILDLVLQELRQR